MKSEIEVLLEELRGMKSSGKKTPENNVSTWENIRKKDWEAAGFENEEVAKAWISDNPYANL